MVKILNYIYNIWCVFWLIIIFLLLFPFMFLTLQFESGKPFTHQLIRVWGILFFFMAGIKIEIEYLFRPQPKAVYVIVANHFSYLDVACMGVVIDNYFAFFGKSTVKRVPLLGYIFAKLHIQVDRGNKWSRGNSLLKGLEALGHGRSICIFPEGGILSQTIPKMLQPLKDGAFVLAIEKQVPILPITLLNNYKLMPNTLLKRGVLKAIIHAPIETKTYTKTTITALKTQVYDIIQRDLDKVH